MSISFSSSVMVFFVPFKSRYWVCLLELFLVRPKMFFVEEKALAVIKSNVPRLFSCSSLLFTTLAFASPSSMIVFFKK